MKKIYDLFKVALATSLAVTVLTVNPVSIFAVDDTDSNTEGESSLSDLTVGNTQDVVLNAKVTDDTTASIKVDLAWGDMEFTYSKGLGTWDTESHTYSGGTTGAWTAYENTITITNHSNVAIKVDTSYAGVTENALGATVNFSITGDENYTSTMNLDTADSFVDTNNSNTNVANLVDSADSALDTQARNTNRRKDFTVTLTGEPSSTAKVDYKTMTKAGTITVTITKDDARQAQYGR